MFVIAFRAVTGSYVGKWWFVAAFASDEAGAAKDAHEAYVRSNPNAEVICFRWSWK